LWAQQAFSALMYSYATLHAGSMNDTNPLPVASSRFLCQRRYLQVVPASCCINTIAYVNSRAPPANAGGCVPSATIPMPARRTNASDSFGISAASVPHVNPVDALNHENQVSVSGPVGCAGLEVLAEAALISDLINKAALQACMRLRVVKIRQTNSQLFLRLRQLLAFLLLQV